MAAPLPHGFVYLEEVDPTIIQDMRYFTNDNFIGRPIKGYEAARCILTRDAAQALASIQHLLKQQGLGVKVYDCYRPQIAVDDFIAWSKDAADQKMKQQFYPHINKADVFQLGYLAPLSSHTRGSTVDLTLVHLIDSQQPLEVTMGADFDFMDVSSHFDAANISEEARHYRVLLRTLMMNAGFQPLETEWWHFTLKNELYPDTYFNFPVK